MQAIHFKKGQMFLNLNLIFLKVYKNITFYVLPTAPKSVPLLLKASETNRIMRFKEKFLKTKELKTKSSQVTFTS